MKKGWCIDDLLSYKENNYDFVTNASIICVLVLNNVKNVENFVLIISLKFFIRP